MPLDPEPPRAVTPETPLDPDAIARFGRLELLARLVVEGVMAGLHRSPFKGVSVEFAEHRPYGPGDEIRHVDWRAFGKTDRYFVKEYEEETNLRVYLVLDTSASMAYAGRTHSKLNHARLLAASLAHLMIGQRDAVGLTTFAAGPAGFVPPRAAPAHFSVLCRALESASPAGELPLHQALHALAARIRRRALVVVLSDAFDQLDELTLALRHLRHRHHELLVFQVLAPEEEDFSFTRPVELRDLERPGSLTRVEPATLRAAYLKRFHDHRRALEERIRELGADYVKASTAEPAERTLIGYLAGRGRGAASVRGGASP